MAGPPHALLPLVVALANAFLPQEQARILAFTGRVQPRRVAVVLNANARRVDDEVVAWVKRVVPEQDLFLTHTLEDLPRVAEKLVARGYDAVLWGGGDGTFANGVAALCAAAGAGAGGKMPDVGTLRLGTGNGIAYSLDASPATPEGLAKDLERARLGTSRRPLQLLEVEGRPTVFTGFGLDAQILDDLGRTVGSLDKMGLADTLRSAELRYFLTVTSRSIPRFLASERPEVVAINRGAPAQRVDKDGNPIGAPIPAGRVLWRGRATLASAGSIEHYGLAMKMFPHAERQSGRFQLRLTDLGAGAILANLPQIWKGRFDHDRLYDFLADEVELVVSRPMPLQAGGDLIGLRSRVTVGLWPRPVIAV